MRSSEQSAGILVELVMAVVIVMNTGPEFVRQAFPEREPVAAPTLPPMEIREPRL